ncbi:MAG: hypothetical protein LBP99_04685 [Azoarcus sp.]|jgi:hypothetical protein|nr:hypothetical protein [Azoarcus sp.]
MLRGNFALCWPRGAGIARVGPKKLLEVFRLKACEFPQWLNKSLPKKFVFKLAQTREELEACFRLLHDEYVRAGFMKPDPSGMRITIHHALPTTSTLMCRHGKHVVGTVSLIRENGLGFPMQRIFNLDEIVQKSGNVAEVSALAINRRFYAAQGRIVMPLLKFLYEYAEYRFDTRHLVIAVHPQYIRFYEDVLCFQRLACPSADHYDFVNNMPAVGAHLDLEKAKEILSRKYVDIPLEKNLFHYFAVAALPNGQFPHKRFDAVTDPVMTPELIDYFFNQKTKIFSALGVREIRLLHTVYNLPEYQHCLPRLPKGEPQELGQDDGPCRYPVRCIASLRVGQNNDVSCDSGNYEDIPLTVYECSEAVFCAHADRPLSVGLCGKATIELGLGVIGFERCTLPVEVLRLGRHSSRIVMLRVCDAGGKQGKLWLKFIHAIRKASKGSVVADIRISSRFSDDVLTPVLPSASE